MSRNGSGTYTLPAGNPVVTGTTITSSWANTTMQNIADGLTQSVASDGQTPMSGSLNMANNKIISVTDPTSAQDAATKAYVDAKTDGTSAGSFTNLAYTGTLTGGTGVVNIGSGQVYKDASGNVCIGTATPTGKLTASVSSGEASIDAQTTDTTTAPAAYFNARGGTYGSTYYRALRGMDATGGTAHWAVGQFNAPEDTLAFYTGTSLAEAMRIDSSGNLMIGTTVTSPTSGYYFAVRGASQLQIGHPNGTGTGTAYEVYYYNQGVIGSINQAGTTSVSYNTTSDYRLKENVAPMTGALARVSQLKPVTYKWKADGSDGQGFIAHELQAIVPDAVTGEKDAVDADGKPIYQGIDTSFLVATLTAAIQELKAEFDTYKASHP